MAQIAFEEITEEWVKLSDLITVDADTTYVIQNRSNVSFLAVESELEPENLAGIVIYPRTYAFYKKGTEDLWMKTFNKGDVAEINISTAGE